MGEPEIPSYVAVKEAEKCGWVVWPGRTRFHEQLTFVTCRANDRRTGLIAFVLNKCPQMTWRPRGDSGPEVTVMC